MMNGFLLCFSHININQHAHLKHQALAFTFELAYLIHMD